MDPTAHLNSISFIFTRATTDILNGEVVGPLDDGIRISGFASDPGVSFFNEEDPVGTLNNVNGVEGVSFAGDTLNIDHTWRGGEITVFEFSSPAAPRRRVPLHTDARQLRPGLHGRPPRLRRERR